MAGTVAAAVVAMMGGGLDWTPASTYDDEGVLLPEEAGEGVAVLALVLAGDGFSRFWNPTPDDVRCIDEWTEPGETGAGVLGDAGVLVLDERSDEEREKNVGASCLEREILLGGSQALCNADQHEGRGQGGQNCHNCPGH